MKRFLYTVLAILMLAISVNFNVYAENGPLPNDFKEITEEILRNPDNVQMSFIALVSYDNNGNTKSTSYLYPQELSEQLPVNSKAIAYREATNTLYISGYTSNELLVVAGMGDDFKIRLSGYNEIGAVNTSDMNWGCSITITGNGGLVVNKEKMFTRAIYMDFTGMHKGYLKVDKTASMKIFTAGIMYSSITIRDVTALTCPEAVIIDDAVMARSFTSSNRSGYTYTTDKFKTLRLREDFCIFEKDGEESYYAGIYNAETYTYKMYSVAYDELFINATDNSGDPYIATSISGQESIYNPAEYGYKKVSNSQIENIFILSDYKYTYNLAQNDEGKIYAFKLTRVDKDEWELTTRAIIHHPVYGDVLSAVTRNGVSVNSNYYENGIDGKAYTYFTYENSGNISINPRNFHKPAQVKINKAENLVGGAKISWVKASGAQQYKVYRKTANAKTWTRIGTTTAASFTDTNVTNKTKYTYTVKASNFTGDGTYDKAGKSIVYVSTPAFTVANVWSGVKVNWGKISGATGYAVYSSQYNAESKKWEPWTKRVTLKAANTAWTDKAVVDGETHRYAVRAFNGNAYSNIRASGIIILKQPLVKFANSPTGIRVVWNKSARATGYTIYRNEYKNGKWTGWTNLGTVSSTKTNFTDIKAVSGATYRYTARAVNGKYRSSYQNIGTVKCK